MDYFGIAHTITNDHMEKLKLEQQLYYLKDLVERQTKLINEQRELIALLKAHLQ